MSGIELAEEVRTGFPQIPVLPSTGYSEALKAATLKGLQILAKPYRTAELCDSVAGLLETQRC